MDAQLRYSFFPELGQYATVLCAVSFNGEIDAWDKRVPLAIVSAFGVVAQPAAQFGDDIVEATTRTWIIASAYGSLGCRLKLLKDKTIGGYALTEASSCGPHTMTCLQHGTSDPVIVFRDATRK
jgi:hypothetical protein